LVEVAQLGFTFDLLLISNLEQCYTIKLNIGMGDKGRGDLGIYRLSLLLSLQRPVKLVKKNSLLQ